MLQQNYSSTLLAPPAGYKSGDTLRNSAIWPSKTLAELNFPPGTYTWTWGDGTFTDSLIINILPPPVISLSCTPASLTDSAGQIATCKVTADKTSTVDLSVGLALPPTSPRYKTDCVSPLAIPANSTVASCTISAEPNTTPNDGDVTAMLALADAVAPAPGAYTVGTRSADVLIKDDDQVVTPPATVNAAPVPTLGEWAVMLLSAVVAGFAAVGLRKRKLV